MDAVFEAAEGRRTKGGKGSRKCILVKVLEIQVHIVEQMTKISLKTFNDTYKMNLTSEREIVDGSYDLHRDGLSKELLRHRDFEKNNSSSRLRSRSREHHFSSRSFEAP